MESFRRSIFSVSTDNNFKFIPVPKCSRFTRLLYRLILHLRTSYRYQFAGTMLSSTDLIALNLSLFQLPLPSLTPPLPHTDFSSSDRQSFLDTLFRNASENLRSIVPLSALLPALST